MVKNARTIVVDGFEYKYAVCKNSGLVIYDPAGRRHLVSFATLTGHNPSEVYNYWDDWFQGGKRSKTDKGVIAKRQVEIAIRKLISKGPPAMTELDVGVLLTEGRKGLVDFVKLGGTLGTKHSLDSLATRLDVASVQAPRTRLKKKVRKLRDVIRATLVAHAFQSMEVVEQSQKGERRYYADDD